MNGEAKTHDNQVVLWLLSSGCGRGAVTSPISYAKA